MQRRIPHTNIHVPRKQLLLVWLLILCSGNPFLGQFQWLNIIISFFFCIYWAKKAKKYKDFKYLRLYLVGIVIIFILQTITLHWNSIQGIVNFCCKVFWGSSVFLILGSRFRYAYLKIMYILAVISLIFWLLYLTTGTVIPGLPWDKGSTWLVYTYNAGSHGEGISLRNCGFPWEPGAFGCYLLLTFILFINDIQFLWKNYKKKCIIILITLLTTMSTTAYVAIAILGCGYVLLRIKSYWKYVWLAAIVCGCVYIGQNVDFLAEKIISQSEEATDANGKFNSTRLGSLLFDLYYIDKHPFVGNGLHSNTRYADHQTLVRLWQKGKEAQSGNGFSSIIASMGLLFILLYGYILIKKNKNYLSTNDLILIFTGLILLLFGEPLMNYSLLIGFPLINFSSKL